MFSLPVTPTAHLPPKAFGSHGSRLSHVSKADPKGYAARHSMLEGQATLGKTASGNPFAPGFTHRSGRHSTPVPTNTTPNRSIGGERIRGNQRSSEAGALDALTEVKPHEAGRGRLALREASPGVSVSATSDNGKSALGSFVANEPSYRSSSSSSQESASQGWVPPQLRMISLDQEAGRIISAESLGGACRVLAWHPSSTGVGGMDRSQSFTIERSAASTGRPETLQGTVCHEVLRSG